MNPIIKIGLAFLAVSGVGATHYFGFTNNIPSSISTFITAELIASFLSVFYFNLFFAAISGRVLAAGFIYAYHSLLFLYMRIREKNKITVARKVSAAIDSESLLVIAFQFPAAIIIFWSTYLKASHGKHFDIHEVFGAFLLLAILLVRFPYAKSAIDRSLLGKVPRSSRLAQNSLPNTLNVLVGILLIISYLAGSARYSLLWARNEVTYSTPKFTRDLNILMQSGSNILAIEHSGFFQRHVLIAKDSIIYELPNAPEQERSFVPFPQ